MLVPEHKPEHAAYPAHAAVAVTAAGAAGVQADAVTHKAVLRQAKAATVLEMSAGLVQAHKAAAEVSREHAAVAVTVLGEVGQEVVHIRNLVRQLLKLAAAMSAEHAQATGQEA